MFKTQLMSDRLAMTLSFACTIHCFFVPSFIILTSGFLFTTIDNEWLHKAILITAVPISLYALTLGYQNHKVSSIFFIGFFGLAALVTAVLLGEAIIGEAGEKTVTFFGSMLVVFAHYRNHQVCKELECSCHEQKA